MGEKLIPKNDAARKAMQANTGKNSKPEMLVRTLLRSKGIKGYRLHYKAPGRPDIAFVGKKVAVFIHGCFWHRCPKCNKPLPKNNSEYWQQKFQRNVARDIQTVHSLKVAGWKPLVFWECEVKEDASRIVRKIQDAIMK